MRVIIYARISRDRVGAGVGVARQIDECTRYADDRGWTVVAVLSDNDLSAYSGKPRPGYRNLLDEITAGNTDAVLCWHTDRLHRAPVELEEYIVACNLHNLSTFSTQAGELDLTTPSGRMVARQLGAIARYESELRSARVKSAKQKLATEGTWSGGGRPFGWEVDGVTEVPQEVRLIVQASTDLIKGKSLVTISREWNTAGVLTARGNRWIAGAVRDVLLRARNAGLREHRGSVIGKGTWSPIMIPETWHAVRKLLTDPGRKTTSPGNQPKYLGAMRYRCGARMLDGSECGHPMKVTKSGKPRIQVYVCTRQPKQGVKHCTMKREKVDEYVITKLINGALEEGASTPNQVVEVTPADTSQIDETMRVIGEEMTSGNLPVDQWRTMNAQLAQRKRDLESMQVDAQVAQLGATRWGNFELDPHGTWEAWSLDEKRDFMENHVIVTVLPSRVRGRWSGEARERIRLDWLWETGE